jgi:hypothetical protein
MRRHLLGPLIRGVHRVRPAHGVVVVGFGSAKVVDFAHQEFGRLDAAHPVQRRHLIEAAVQRALGGCAVVTEDVVDQRVVKDFEVLQRVEQAADMVVGMLEEPGTALHLAAENGLERLRHVVPRGDFGRPLCEYGISWNDAQLLLTGKGLLAERVPACVELALVLVDPVFGNVMRRVRRARREVHEKWLVGHERLLLPHPPHRLVRHVLREVVAVFGTLARLHQGCALVDRRIPLVGLAAEETVTWSSPRAASRESEGWLSSRLLGRILLVRK